MEIIDSGKEPNETIKIAEEILGILETKKTLIYCFHTLLDQFELHLDSITKKYKAMTATFLLATFAAIGFLFSVETKELQINKLIVTGLVCIFGIIGTYSMWYLDIRVFHRFWGAFFVEEVRMEKTFSFLIDIGDVSVSLDHVKARIIGNGNFYIAIISLLIVTLGISLSFIIPSIWFKVLIYLCALISAFLVIRSMHKACRVLQRALERLLSVEYQNSLRNPSK